MSGTIAALTPHTSSPLKNPELREHYSRLSVRLQDPYFRMMIIHMGVGDWLEVLEEDVIPFRERLAIAFQFLDDRSLKSYLQRITADASQTGNIDAIIVTGLTKQGLDILQAYVDRTGDVQTVAIMGSYVCPVKFHDRRVERWLNAYREMLDGFRLHPERVGFDIERGQLVLDALQNGESLSLSRELVPPQILIRCHYCNKPVNTTEITGVGPNKARVRPIFLSLERVQHADRCCSRLRVLTVPDLCPNVPSA
jgi:WD repeat-containing protein mio